MRVVLVATSVVAVLTISAGITFAQAPATPPAAEAPQGQPAPVTSPPPAAAAPESAKPAPTVSKARECRLQVKQKGLRGRAASDEVAVCLAEARLECTKQAVAHNFGRRELAAFIRQCMGQRARGKRK
jgi:hypothetical protein